jgi:hypothetical protein
MLSSSPDTIERRQAVNVNGTGENAGGISKFVGSWIKPTSEGLEVMGRNAAERSYFEETGSIESVISSESGRESDLSISSISSTPDLALPIKYELRGKLQTPN